MRGPRATGLDFVVVVVLVRCASAPTSSTAAQPTANQTRPTAHHSATACHLSRTYLQTCTYIDPKN
eukprot:scaffold22314_cov103-Isochrysis_galbana.AAC.2